MNLFKNFFRLLNKNKNFIIIYTVIFSVLVVAMGSMFGVTSDSIFKEDAYTICYVDEDNSELTKGIIAFLSEANKVEDVSDRDDTSVQNLLFFRTYMHELKFAEGFENKVLAGEDISIDYVAGLPSGVQAYVIKNQVDTYISTYKLYVEMGYSNEEAAIKTNELVKEHSEVNVMKEDGEVPANENQIVFSGAMYFWYALFSSICFSAGVVVLSGMEENLSARIEAAPVSRAKRNLINTLAITLFGLAYSGIFLLIMFIIGKDSNNLQQYGVVYVVNVILATFVITSMTSFITSFKIKATNINMLTNIVGMACAFLGGEFVPMDILGEGVLKVGRFLPSYWFVYVNNMTYSRGAIAYNIDEVYKAFGIQILFILVFWIGAAAVGKIRSNSRG